MSEKNTQWYEVRQSHNLGYRLMFFALRVFPAPLMRLLAYAVGFFYWLFDKKTRRVSRLYLSKVGKRSTLKHICSFALNLVENVQTWAGKFSVTDLNFRDDDVQDLLSHVKAKEGTLVIISHLGNAQMMKGLAILGENGIEQKMEVTTISNENISGGFNSMLSEVNPDSSINHVSSDNIGPETIFYLQEQLEKGNLVVIAGDRVSAHSDRTIEIDFLGEKARFPYGVFLLISLLNVPTYFINGMRHKDICLNPKYDMCVKKNPLDFNCGRKEREERIRQTARYYAENLEKLCKAHPYQWYNFFDFWS
ncbi:MAG: hypothetical protein J6I53_13270 [Treponema sp.]|nr:hypothetical protein [Treponema sp.]